MEWIEVKPIPDECRSCQEEDCDGCDIAGNRWTLSRASELRAKRMLLVRAILRLQRQVEQIDRELQALTEQN